MRFCNYSPNCDICPHKGMRLCPGIAEGEREPYKDRKEYLRQYAAAERLRKRMHGDGKCGV